jgi:hypothetical protein
MVAAQSSKEKMTLRATAMRAADALSRINGDIDDGMKIVSAAGGKRKEYSQFFTASLRPHDWPVIDADPLLFSLEDESRFFLVDDGKEPACWPVSTGIVFPEMNGFTRIAMVQSIEPASVRGQARVFSKYMVRASSIDIGDGNRLIGTGSGVFARVGPKWVDAVGRDVKMPHHGVTPQSGQGIPVLMGHVLRQRYEWSAIFHFPTGLRLRFGCSAHGVLELFRDREKDLTLSRRAALLHWVRRHWRQRRFRQSDAATEVRQHLRGVTTVNWRGMDVTIVPAMFEVEHAE